MLHRASASVPPQPWRKAGKRASWPSLSTDISLWELALLIDRGRLQLPDDVSPVAYLSRLLQALRLQVLPITADIAVLSRSSLFQHGDTADRLIAATALHGGWPLITADEKLRALPELHCIW